MTSYSYRPRIVALISHLSFSGHSSKLAQTVEEILPRYASHADVEVIETTIADLLPAAKRLENEQNVDIFICSGASAEFLRKNISTTVLSIRMGEYDLIRALNLAKDRGTKAGILSHILPHSELKEMASLFTVEIYEAVYSSLEDARQKIQELVAAGYRVIVGSPTAVELAEEAGAEGVSVINADAVRRTLEDALAICRSRVHEKLKHQRINTVLQHLTEGVIALDIHGQVQSINPSMSQMLNLSEKHIINKNARFALPDLDIERVLKTGIGEDNLLIKFGNRRVAASIMPLFEAGQVDGAIIVCQEINAIQRSERHIRSQARPRQFIAKYEFSQLLGDSIAFRQAIDLAKLYASTTSTVLITGESGTGKELIAQSIHNASSRRQAPFVAINCASFPETLLESELFGYEEGAFTGTKKGGKSGLFEAGHTGTIFLDEIGDIPVPLQTRLLRVLQEREVLRLGSSEPTPVDIRVIAATHHKLSTRIEEGLFREDLFYRLNILRITVPPLRQRIEDIPIISNAILANLSQHDQEKQNQARALVHELMPRLLAHRWRGNIRELENIVERACLSVYMVENGHRQGPPLETLFPELFPITDTLDRPSKLTGTSLQALGKAAEIAYIKQTLKENAEDMTKTAKHLGISRSTLWRRLRKDC